MNKERKTDAPLYDDNFGAYDMSDDPEEKAEFYRQVQLESELKICVLCDQEVWLRRSYDKCNSCMEKLERGMEW